MVPGYNSRSPELELSAYEFPGSLKRGDRLELWNTEDLDDSSEQDNDSAKVLGYIIQ